MLPLRLKRRCLIKTASLNDHDLSKHVVNSKVRVIVVPIILQVILIAI